VSAVDTGHRSGCAFGRTARCTCTYLAQWDKAPAYTAPAFSGGPDKPAPKLHLPVVIATGGDPAELAEKIVRQNPEYFGHIDPDGIYRPSDTEDTVPREVWKQDLSDTELKVKYWHKEYKQVRKNFYTMFGLALAGWLLALARGIWGF
jgi:hypothetical protein